MKAWEWKPGNGSLGMEAWEWKPGNGSLGMEAWEWKPGNGSLGMEAWEWKLGNGSLGVKDWELALGMKVLCLTSGLSSLSFNIPFSTSTMVEQSPWMLWNDGICWYWSSTLRAFVYVLKDRGCPIGQEVLELHNRSSYHVLQLL